jgi:hypothetical protein
VSGNTPFLSSQESSPPGGVKEKSRDSIAEEQEHKCQVTHLPSAPRSPPHQGESRRRAGTAVQRSRSTSVSPPLLVGWEARIFSVFH